MFLPCVRTGNGCDEYVGDPKTTRSIFSGLCMAKTGDMHLHKTMRLCAHTGSTHTSYWTHPSDGSLPSSNTEGIQSAQRTHASNPRRLQQELFSPCTETERRAGEPVAPHMESSSDEEEDEEDAVLAAAYPRRTNRQILFEGEEIVALSHHPNSTAQGAHTLAERTWDV
jgi:hypothetical protein